MGAIEAINIILCNIINFRKELVTDSPALLLCL